MYSWFVKYTLFAVKVFGQLQKTLAARLSVGYLLSPSRRIRCSNGFTQSGCTFHTHVILSLASKSIYRILYSNSIYSEVL